MTRISNMPIVSSDDTKDSSNSTDVAAIAEGDVVVSLQEGAVVGGISITQHANVPLPQPLNLQAIKQEKDVVSSVPNTATSVASTLSSSGTASLPNVSNTMKTTFNPVTNASNANKIPVPDPPLRNSFPHPPDSRNSSGVVDLTEFAEWVKIKSDHQRHCQLTYSPDADQSFLNSLHPYLKEMSGKQNRRFRQKVVALIDAILENAD